MTAIASAFNLPTDLLNDEPTGTLARTIPRSVITSTSVAAYSTTGQVSVRLLALPGGLTVTNIQVLFGGTAAVAPTHFWLALTDINLNVLAVSADQGTNAQTNATALKLAMGTPYVIPVTGAYYVAASSTATTTTPTAAGAAQAGGLPGIAPVFCGTAGTQTTPPTVGTQINGGTITAGVQSNFAAWIS